MCIHGRTYIAVMFRAGVVMRAGDVWYGGLAGAVGEEGLGEKKGLKI
jgi:hypothetical protein